MGSFRLLEGRILEEEGDSSLSFPFTCPLRMLSVRLRSSWVLLQAFITDEMSCVMAIALAEGWGTLIST
jgi:hypothetical protein